MCWVCTAQWSGFWGVVQAAMGPEELSEEWTVGIFRLKMTGSCMSRGAQA